MTMFIDNRHKDLTEVRCKDTGILLGFAPRGLCSEEPEVQVALRSAIPVADNPYVKTELQAAHGTPSVTFMRMPLNYGLSKRVECVEISREDWEKLINSFGG